MAIRSSFGSCGKGSRTGAWAAIAVAAGIAACGPEPEPVRLEPSSTRKVGEAEITGINGKYRNHAWLGIRFAKAPKGELRFRAPQAIAPSGKHDAKAFGAPCPQLGHPFGVAEAKRGEPVGDEDCLFLNVYAPKLAAAQVAEAKLPIMVWFHGGGNLMGHASGYDGGNLAQRERVIVVTANYRLGPLGWFRHASLREGSSPEDASGNFGQLDQIAALRWVQQHVAAFGGDPGNVTIFGESAGARDVIALLIAPAARNLFHRAIVQSGNARIQSAEQAEAFASEGGHVNSSGEVLLRLLLRDGKAPDAAKARAALAQMKPAEVSQYLRSKTPFELLGAYKSESLEGAPNVPNVFNDGVVLPKEQPFELFARPGAAAPVPVMFGTNRDEAKTFMLSDPLYVRRFTPLYTRLRDPERYNARAQAISRAWKVNGADAPAAALAAGGGRAYVYRFDWDEEPTILGADVAMMLGAGHGIEIPFVFGHWYLGPASSRLFTDGNKAGRIELAHEMMGYWGEFARSGNPGKGRGGAGPEWPAFRAEAGGQAFMVFDTAQGGGVRVESGALTIDAVLASVAKDKRLRTPDERCGVLREVARSAGPSLDPQALAAHGGAECAATATVAANR